MASMALPIFPYPINAILIPFVFAAGAGFATLMSNYIFTAKVTN
jgi:hypothetical protein